MGRVLCDIEGLVKWEEYRGFELLEFAKTRAMALSMWPRSNPIQSNPSPMDGMNHQLLMDRLDWMF